MKKIVAFVLAAVYLASSVGATVHLHYCMDKLVNWSFNEEGDKCKNCGMEKDGGCCKDEQKFFKNSSDQSAAGTIQLHHPTPTESLVASIDPIKDVSHSLLNQRPISHAPPISKGTDIFILNCILRI